jgi:hypothetical protein
MLLALGQVAWIVLGVLAGVGFIAQVAEWNL